ncbi:hypothetical protein Agub_g7410 [Astrephomene gubernaculifera]|uniref:Uncharacterized protein n=1 Tax=Astrephomene gubernaculifera TaxID=47775 RepID=A0AAD3DQ27_9CHLO|nr:hypothetical protein Agub_g7410 [Astrephomene gubernaculifera]
MCCTQLRDRHDAVVRRISVTLGEPANPAFAIVSSLRRIFSRGCSPSYLLLRCLEENEPEILNVMATLKTLSNLAELWLHGCALTPNVTTAVAGTVPQLTSLTLSGASVSDHSLQTGLGSVLHALPKLEHIGLYGAKDAKDVPEPAWLALSQHNSLRSLDTGSLHVGQLSVLTNLHALRLSGAPLKIKIEAFQRCIAALTGLTSLKLFTAISSQTDMPAVPCLSALVNLRELDVNNLPLSREDLLALPQLTALTSLKSGLPATNAVLGRPAGPARAAIPWQLPPNLKQLFLRKQDGILPEQDLNLLVLAALQPPPASLAVVQLSDNTVVKLPSSSAEARDALQLLVPRLAACLQPRSLHLRDVHFRPGVFLPLGAHAHHVWLPLLGGLRLARLVLQGLVLQGEALQALAGPELGETLETLSLLQCRMEPRALTHLDRLGHLGRLRVLRADLAVGRLSPLAVIDPEGPHDDNAEAVAVAAVAAGAVQEPLASAAVQVAAAVEGLLSELCGRGAEVEVAVDMAGWDEERVFVGREMRRGLCRERLTAALRAVRRRLVQRGGAFAHPRLLRVS